MEHLLNTLHNLDIFEFLELIPDNSVDAIINDLPYGTTQNKWDVIIPLDKMWKEYMRIIKPNRAIVLTAMQPFTSILVSSNIENFHYDWIWHKTRATNFLNANKMPMRSHEDILIFSKGGKPQYFPQGEKIAPTTRKFGDRGTGNYGAFNSYEKTFDTTTPKSVITFQHDLNDTVKNNGKTHPTQKPVSLFRYLARTYTKPGEVVVDPTAGSFTTAIACFPDRYYICNDKDTNYYNFGIERVKNIDPFKAKETSEGKQLSLFDGVE